LYKKRSDERKSGIRRCRELTGLKKTYIDYRVREERKKDLETNRKKLFWSRERENNEGGK